MHDIIRRICTLGWSIKRRAIDKRPSLIFGVGLPKTGTTSIAYLLGPERHGYHEKNRARSINVIRLYCSGDINIGRLERWFVIRDIYLYPVFDIAHYYGAIADEMVGLFPNSKFLITLRDCYSWAQSFGNQVIKRWRWKNGWSEDCEDYLVKWQKYQFGHPGAWSYPSPESELQEVGMPPLSVLYQYYRGRNRKLLDAIPPDRRIVLKTSELSQSISRIEHSLLDRIQQWPLSKKRDLLQAPPRFGFVGCVPPV